MHSYPLDYLLHPVPVMAIYGLSPSDEPSLLDAPISEETSSQSPKPSVTLPKSNLTCSLLELLTSKTEYTLYEATAYLSNQQTPPPFRVITVSKVRKNKVPPTIRALTFCINMQIFQRRITSYHSDNHLPPRT